MTTEGKYSGGGSCQLHSVHLLAGWREGFVGEREIGEPTREPTIETLTTAKVEGPF